MGARLGLALLLLPACASSKPRGADTAAPPTVAPGSCTRFDPATATTDWVPATWTPPDWCSYAPARTTCEGLVGDWAAWPEGLYPGTLTLCPDCTGSSNPYDAPGPIPPWICRDGFLYAWDGAERCIGFLDADSGLLTYAGEVFSRTGDPTCPAR